VKWMNVLWLAFALSVLTFLAAWSSYTYAENPIMDPQKQIFMGCAMKAEMTLYIAQERLYNNGSERKLLDFMKENMNDAQFEINAALFAQLGAWVDGHQFATAKEYSRAVMQECVQNSFEILEMEPDEETDGYIARFEKLLQDAQERLFPTDYYGSGPEIGA